MSLIQSVVTIMVMVSQSQACICNISLPIQAEAAGADAALGEDEPMAETLPLEGEGPAQGHKAGNERDEKGEGDQEVSNPVGKLSPIRPTVNSTGPPDTRNTNYFQPHRFLILPISKLDLHVSEALVMPWVSCFQIHGQSVARGNL